MYLPGRLKATTLGDLLGTILRSRATGTLELTDEPRGRTHRVFVTGGLVLAVAYDGAGPTLADILRRDNLVDEATLRRARLRALATRRLHGEVLVQDFDITPAVIDVALRKQLAERLSIIEKLGDARITFHVTLRPPHTVLGTGPLDAREFLSGRRRTRDRTETRAAHFPGDPLGAAWKLLGLTPGAGADEVKRSFRQLVRRYHPDLHPQATDAERRELSLRFGEVTQAYRLVSEGSRAA